MTHERVTEVKRWKKKKIRCYVTFTFVFKLHNNKLIKNKPSRYE